MVQEVYGHQQCEGPDSSLGALLPRLPKDFKAATPGKLNRSNWLAILVVYMSILALQRFTPLSLTVHCPFWRSATNEGVLYRRFCCVFNELV